MSTALDKLSNKSISHTNHHQQTIQ